MNVNVYITVLSFSQCMVFNMGDIYDFQVYCSDGERYWRGACFRRDLQTCVEMGIGAFDET